MGRALGRRDPGPVIWVLCEGKTERLYLEHIARHHRRTGVTIVGEQGVPSTLVEKAVDRVRRLRRGARKGVAADFEVWAVCDRDEHPGTDSPANLRQGSGQRQSRTGYLVQKYASFLDHSP